MRILWLSLIPAILLVFSPRLLAETANTPVLTDGAALNQAGRQRMLSERMVKAYIQLAADIDTIKAEKQLQLAKALFTKQLENLRAYAPTLRIQKNLRTVDEHWGKLQMALSAGHSSGLQHGLQHGLHHKLQPLIALGEELVAACHQVVLDIEAYAGTDSAVLVNVSGRQRMLSQRMAKYYFAHLSGENLENITADFYNTLGEFEQGLAKLIGAPQNSSEIQDALYGVEAQLAFSKSGFKRLESRQYTPHVISRTTESMLKRMDEITGMYQRLHDGPV